MRNFKFQISNLKFPRPAPVCLLLAAYCLASADYRLLPRAHAAAWEKQRTGTFAWLHAVFFVDERRGWAAGGKGALLSTADGGAMWEVRTPPTEDAVRDLFFHDAETGWLLCERSMFKPMEKEESVSYLLKTADGGRTWARVEVTRGADVDLKLAGLRFAGRERGWAYGEMGALFATADGGATWARQRVPTRHLLLGASFLDARTGWLSGGGLTVLKTTDGGASWHAGTVFLPASGGAVPPQLPEPKLNEGAEETPREAAARRFSRRLNAVCFVSPARGWAVGANGIILSTGDGGRTWRPQASGVGDDLFDVKFFDESEGWAVGSGGTMLHTTDGGATWKDARRVTAHALERLFTVGRRAWAVGFGGTAVALKG
ncbi:MAG TPA: YCF48-related protein [Pyrinomonadaceae bacterium]|jgi:photosystem II stability/assembly factor-like uncharacterized protein